MKGAYREIIRYAGKCDAALRLTKVMEMAYCR